MSDQDFVERDILKFISSKNYAEGANIHLPSMNYMIFSKYNPKQKLVVEDAFNALINKGILEEQESALILTKHGVEKIY